MLKCVASTLAMSRNTSHTLLCCSVLQCVAVRCSHSGKASKHIACPSTLCLTIQTTKNKRIACPSALCLTIHAKNNKHKTTNIKQQTQNKQHMQHAVDNKDTSSSLLLSIKYIMVELGSLRAPHTPLLPPIPFSDGRAPHAQSAHLPHRHAAAHLNLAHRQTGVHHQVPYSPGHTCVSQSGGSVSQSEGSWKEAKNDMEVLFGGGAPSYLTVGGAAVGGTAGHLAVACPAVEGTAEGGAAVGGMAAGGRASHLAVGDTAVGGGASEVLHGEVAIEALIEHEIEIEGALGQGDTDPFRVLRALHLAFTKVSTLYAMLRLHCIQCPTPCYIRYISRTSDTSHRYPYAYRSTLYTMPHTMLTPC